MSFFGFGQTKDYSLLAALKYLKTRLMSSSFHNLIKEKRVLICCGSGGVGKTTTSAALALFAAAQGLKTLVLTIDPAKRLANSLGIQDIDYQEREIPKEKLQQAGVITQAPLYAMMMDTKHTFDNLIKKHSANSKKAEEILSNQLYRHLSNMIAGSQEYMAMEKLYEILEERDYDLVVLDTPPSRHALDFLDAPRKMKALIGDSILKWFLKPSIFVGRAGFKLLDRPMRRVFKTLDRVAGFEFLQDLSVLLISTSDLLDGFQERAEKVETLLKASHTSFLLIASPHPIPISEANFFYQKIEKSRLPFAGFIFNRVRMPNQEKIKDLERLSGKARQEYQKVKSFWNQLAKRDREELAQFKESLGRDAESYIFQSVPEFERDIHDLKGLYCLAKLAFSS